MQNMMKFLSVSLVLSPLVRNAKDADTKDENAPLSGKWKHALGAGLTRSWKRNWVFSIWIKIDFCFRIGQLIDLLLLNCIQSLTAWLRVGDQMDDGQWFAYLGALKNDNLDE